MVLSLQARMDDISGIKDQTLITTAKDGRGRKY
jgi:hypothetical protein